MPPIIKVQNLRKVYRVGHEKVIALNHINIEIEPGEFCCIVGASGSGKSTLLNQLAGLEKPTHGEVFIAGQNISGMTENELAVFRQNNLGFVFQSYNLLPTLTALENVALPLMFKGMSKRKREKIAAEQLKAMGLIKRKRHKPTEMSGGQQQRVGIARAFAGHPKVIFADEPTGNLDSHTTAQVMNAVLRLTRKHGITFVMVTHERELSGCADRIITIKDGCVLRNEKVDNPVQVFEAMPSPMDAEYARHEQALADAENDKLDAAKTADEKAAAQPQAPTQQTQQSANVPPKQVQPVALQQQVQPKEALGDMPMQTATYEQQPQAAKPTVKGVKS